MGAAVHSCGSVYRAWKHIESRVLRLSQEVVPISGRPALADAHQRLPDGSSPLAAIRDRSISEPAAGPVITLEFMRKPRATAARGFPITYLLERNVAINAPIRICTMMRPLGSGVAGAFMSIISLFD